jgi:hypothetical protein
VEADGAEGARPLSFVIGRMLTLDGGLTATQ